MQLAAHAKSSTLYGRSYSLKSKFFRLDRLILFPIQLWGYAMIKKLRRGSFLVGLSL